MPEWKRIAFEGLPECRKALQENAALPYCFFSELLDMLEWSIRVRDDDLAQRISDYIKWVLESCPRGIDAGNDPYTMAVCSFIEHVPDNELVLAYLGGHWDRSFKVKVLPYMCRHGSSDVLANFVK